MYKKSDIKVLDKIASVHKGSSGYDLCFCQVTHNGSKPRIDFRFVGPAGEPGYGIALDDVDFTQLLSALVETIKWKEDPENIAF